MRAVLIRQFGDPKQLKVEEVTTPKSQGDEVLVAIHAAAINPSDIKNVAGAMHSTTLPRIPGRDFAGTVAAGPEDLIGREVFGTGGGLGFTHEGTHAEFVVVSRGALAIKPSALPMDRAGAAGVTFVTAWIAIVTVARTGPGDVVVVIGGAGGVGSAAIQIAKVQGARVIGVVRSEEDVSIARGYGADDVIISKVGNLAQSVRDLTANRGAQIVFDTSGMMFAETVEMAAMEGRIPIITAPKDGMATFNLRTLYRKALRIEGIDTLRLSGEACAALLAQMSSHFQSGKFTVQAVESRSLKDAVAAYLEASQGGRRVVLRPRM